MSEKSKFRLEKISIDEKWDAFLNLSPNSTVFGNSNYLKGLDIIVDAYYLLKGETKKAGFFGVRKNNRNALIEHPFVIYSGLFFAPFDKEVRLPQIRSDKFEMAEYVANEITGIYSEIKFNMHPSVDDLRPFLWVNYNQERGRYNCNLRYTSELDISSFITRDNEFEIDGFHQLSSSRKQEVRYSRKKQEIIEVSRDYELLSNFYTATLKRQGKDVDHKFIQEMMTLVKHICENGIGEMVVSKTCDGEPGSVAVFCWDNKRAYYLFGASNPNLRKHHTGTSVLWNSFFDLNKKGINHIDLEGVNSPYRGWFKLSFGGDMQAYYELSYE